MSGDNEPQAELSDLAGPMIKTVDEAVSLAVEYYNENPADEAVIEARKCMAAEIREFHRKTGILDDTAKAELAKFIDPAALVVEVAHQPNIFPYAGYFKKIVVGKHLGDALSEKLDAPVVVTFGFVDQDLSNPKWFRTTNLPDINSQNGVLTLKLPVSRKNKKAMYANPPPDDKQVEAWKVVLENWLTNNIRRFNKLIKTDTGTVGLPKDFMLDKNRTNVIRGRIRRIYELMDECRRLAGSITEYNAFFTARFVSGYWKYPILFYEYSKVQHCFGSEYIKLINSDDLLKRYSRAFSAAYRKVNDKDLTFDFNLPSADQAPFWYRCGCGGKVEVSFDLPGPSYRVEQCPECDKAVEINFNELGKDDINELISPRAVYRPILITNTLKPSIFVSGLAASGFHMITRGIASELEIPLPPYIVWPGGDTYRSLAKLVAELTKAGLARKSEAELTMKDKKILENYPNTIATVPSIIDHIVNIGLNELSAAWEECLRTNKGLAEIPELPSIFDPSL